MRIIYIRLQITDSVEDSDFAYFSVKLGDQEKYWAPHIEAALQRWPKEKVF